MKSRDLRKRHPDAFKELDEDLISAETAARLYEAAVVAGCSRRGIPKDPTVPSIHAEAVQRVYRCGYERARREILASFADDGK